MSLNLYSTCRNSSLIAVFLLLLQSLNTVEAQSKKKVEEENTQFVDAENIITRNLKNLGGEATIWVMKDTVLLHRKDFGEFTARTQLPIGALSRLITAALIMKLVEEGKLDLEDPVAKYLPIFEKYSKGYITIRHCLVNLTGNESNKGGLFQKKKFSSLEETVNSLVQREIYQNAGEAFHYGDIGTIIAGRVAEVASKKPFDRLVQEKITRPLKMRTTTFSNDDGSAPDPASGAKSTAADLANFVKMLMNKGSFEGKQILTEESIKKIFTPQIGDARIVYIPPFFKDYSYGLGVFIEELANDGVGKTISAPGFEGVWLWIDRSRPYAALIFTKSSLGTQKNEIQTQIRSAIEEAL